MPVLIRKQSVATWRHVDWADPDHLPADVITGGEFRTKGNTLSFWQASDNDAEDLRRATLALVASLSQIETIDIVQIPRADLPTITFKSTPGLTAAKGCEDMHVDAAELTHQHLGLIANRIGQEVYGDKAKRIIASDLKKIIRDALDSGEIDIGKLADRVREKVVALAKAPPQVEP